jgi:2-polyprenyl-6-methoxyphenol hydroxylase-like FAD-dependent oxidoreductase
MIREHPRCANEVPLRRPLGHSVPAKSHWRGDTLQAALATYIRRREPRVTWVQQQSRAVAESFKVDPAKRNDMLRSKGEGIFRDRFVPLTRDD